MYFKRIGANFMHICTYRTKFYRMTAAASLAACTCALGLPVDVFAQTAAAPSSHAEKSAQTPTPAPSAAPAPATKHSIAPATDRSANDANTKVYDTAANYTITNQDDNSITFSYVKNKNKISNPFPDVISDEEIEAAFKKGDVCIKKALFLPNPTPDNPNPRPITPRHGRIGYLRERVRSNNTLSLDLPITLTPFSFSHGVHINREMEL